MRRFLIPLSAAVALHTAFNTSFDNSIHKMCLDAKDYLGCLMRYIKNTRNLFQGEPI